MSPPNIMQNEVDNIRVAITSNSINHRNYLQKSIEQTGINVVINEALTDRFIEKLGNIKTDLVLFDMESIEEKYSDCLDQLLEQSKIPVVINDVSALTINEPQLRLKIKNKLLEKIAEITGRKSWDASNSKAIPEPAEKKINYNNGLAKNVWVLGASLGGPDALKQFFVALPKNVPAAFIVAQHLGENFVSLLAEQLSRYTDFNVMVAKSGHVLRHNEILIAPTDKRLVINSIGAVELSAVINKTQYTPSINNVINDISLRYKTKTGVIIFSGMCDDGVEASLSLAEKGGQVWTQDENSCVISAMPESVRKHVPVSFSGTPEKLAKHLLFHLNRKQTW